MKVYSLNIKYGLYFVVLLLFFACSNNENTEQVTVAKVGERTLYLSDVNEFVPTDLGEHDSSLMAEDYIKKWVRQELLIQKAGSHALCG